MSESTSPTHQRKRVLSGMRPTGKLHLGNYMGALYNWVKLQNELDESGQPKYDCYFFIADYHALTTEYPDPSAIPENTREVALDFLAGGLDPERSTLFIQSKLPQHAELFTLFAMFTPLSWLERVPTYKDQQEQLREKDLATYGFLGYPLLQAADILLYTPAFVPVGQDQVAHVELTREVAHRFNFFYPRGGLSQRDRGKHPDHRPVTIARWEGEEILPEPKVLVTASPKLPGTDGRKMSKSYGNTILLSDPETEIRAKLKTMVTDPARIRRSDPGNPEVCPVGDLHKVFSTDETRLKVWEGCTTAGIGCIECKSWAADAIVKELAPIQERRRKYEAQPQMVTDILEAGRAKASIRAEQTMVEVREAMRLA